MGLGGLSERSGFRARAGTLTLLMLAAGEGAEPVLEGLARIDAEMFDADWDSDSGDWEEDERDDDEDPLESLIEDAPIPPVLERDMRSFLAEERRGLERELRYVADVLAGWLRESPTGPLRIREEEGMLAIGALAGGWASTVVHALSGAALTFEEVERATGAVSREALKARIVALEDAGLIELLAGPDGEARYAATPWLRRGIAALGAAARHECRLPSSDSAPPDVLDVGAAFLLTLPLVELPAGLSGECRLGVWMPRGGRRVPGARLGMAGATAHVESGRIVSVDLELDPSPSSWAAGSPIGWLDTLVDPSAEKIDVGGGVSLAEALIEGLHEALFGEAPPSDEHLPDRVS